jgi:hypothetical protein
MAAVIGTPVWASSQVRTVTYRIVLHPLPRRPT